jgi:hypothetical protein
MGGAAGSASGGTGTDAGSASGGTGGDAGRGASAGAAGSSAGGGGDIGAPGGAAGSDAGIEHTDAGFEVGSAGARASDGGAGVGGAAGMAPPGNCGTLPGSLDSMTTFTQKVIMVSGVDPAFIAKYPVNAGAQFTWTRRNFFVRLPVGYKPTVAYPVDLEGRGCAGGETTGSTGEYALPATPNQTEAIQVGLSYVTSAAATPDCPEWAYDYPNSPEPAYLHAVIAAVENNYCVDKSRVFLNGYSVSGVLAEVGGCTNADEIRAYGVQIGGGLPMKHPPCKSLPVAAMYVVGLLDQGDPIGPLATPQFDTIGSVASRDELLHRNGCVAPDFQIVDTCAHGAMLAANEVPALPCAPGVNDGDTYSNVPHAIWDPAFPKCQTYTGCPPKYPVVWCPIDVNHGSGPNPMGPDGTVVESYRRTALWKFFSTLPAP